MEAFDVDGLFWMEEVPEEQVAGRLRFEPQTGASLELIGAFTRPEPTDELGGSLRMHGLAGNKLVTLENCVRSGRTREWPGPGRERYRVSFILSGAHLNGPDLSHFTAVHLRMRHLDQWAYRPGRFVDITSNDSEHMTRRLTIAYDPIETVVASTELGDLELSFPITTTQEFAELELTQSCSLGIRFLERHTLRYVLSLCASLQNLITICVDAPAIISDISLSHADLVLADSAGVEPTYRPLQLHTRLQGGSAATSRDDILQQNMLLDSGRHWWVICRWQVADESQTASDQLSGSSRASGTSPIHMRRTAS